MLIERQYADLAKTPLGLSAKHLYLGYRLSRLSRCIGDLSGSRDYGT